MNLYRIVPDIYLENFSGKGASFVDGARWNDAGLQVLYFALSPSVAMLEMANYFPSPRLIPKNMVLGIYELPDNVAIEEVLRMDLPDHWNVYPYPNCTQEIGSVWLSFEKTLCLKVPSAATPDGLESMMVLNPLHADIQHLKLIDKKTKLFNERAFVGSK